MAEEFYENILDNIYEGIYYVDNNKKITYWNKAAERISGFTKDEVVSRSCADNILRHIDADGNELCITGCPLGQTLIDGKIRDALVYLHHKSGHRVPVSVRISPIRDEKGMIAGAIEIFNDKKVDDEALKEIERLTKEVYTDVLTGASNRKYAELILKKNLEERKAVGLSFGVLFLDVDHFKSFNDSYGHKTGDRVLKMVSNTIKSVLRGFDSVCRMGGEEFIVVLPNIDPKTLNTVAERIRVFIEKSWIENDGINLRVTVSVGGTMANNEDTVDTIIDRADKLMYKSKSDGRNRTSTDS